MILQDITKGLSSLASLRERLAAQPVWIAVAAVLAIGIALFSYYRSFRAPNLDWDLKFYFIDDDTGEVMVKTDRHVPPLMGKGGKPTVFQAVYLTAPGKEKTLAYLQKYTDEGKARYEKILQEHGHPSGFTLMGLLGEVQVRKLEKGSPWFPADSPEGTAIRNAFAASLPPGTKVTFCNPPQ